MKGSLTATSSISSLWSATLATKRPILPNPEQKQRKTKRKMIRSNKNHFGRLKSTQKHQNHSNQHTIDTDPDLSCKKTTENSEKIRTQPKNEPNNKYQAKESKIQMKKGSPMTIWEFWKQDRRRETENDDSRRRVKAKAFIMEWGSRVFNVFWCSWVLTPLKKIRRNF